MQGKSMAEFVDVWLEAYRLDKGQAWIGDQLGVSRQNVGRTAERLRKRGVKLPNLLSFRYEVDVPALNKIIADGVKKKES